MRRALACAVVLPTLALAVVPAEARTRPHHKRLPPPCEPGSTPYKSRPNLYRRTLAADTVAQVYSLGASRPSPETFQAGDRLIYGCVYGQHGAHLLGTEPFNNGGKYMSLDVSGDRNVMLAGTVVAYEGYTMTEGLCGFQFHVTVEDLRTGTVFRHEPVGTRTVPGPAFECESSVRHTGLGHTTEIVVAADGAVAWIFEPQPFALEGHYVEAGYQVHAADATGSRLLASGPDIDPTSLALAESMLYWTQDGQPHATPLN